MVAPKPRRQAAAALAMALSLPLGGCCSLARLLCGPDRSPWVSESYRTPEEAVATLCETARRDDPVTAFRALSPRYRSELGATGSFEFGVIWERLKRQVPGLHMLGYAVIESSLTLPDGRRRFLLETSGHRVELIVAQVASWTVIHGASGDPPQEEGRYLSGPDRLWERIDLGPGGELVVRIPWEPTTMGPVQPDQIRQVTLGLEWKVDQVRDPEAAGGGGT